MLVLYLIVGIVVGISINYLVEVLPQSRKVTQPICPVCGQSRKAMDYLLFWQTPQCGHGKPIGALAIVAGSVIVSALFFLFPIPNLSFWASLSLVLYLGVVLVIDIKHRLILLETNLFGMALCFVYGFLLNGFLGTAFGGLGGFAIMLSFYLLGKLFSTIVGKLRHREISEVAFGFGDVLIGGALGFLVGWPAVIGIVLIALVTFGVFSVVYLLVLVLTKRYQSFSTALPFAPFLILGAVFMLYI
jgi:leader peptidase (prepilin peptidase)/N-methyltransferase